MSSLQGKVIAITGAGSGIGLATARECARRGAAGLALCDVNEQGIQSIVAELKDSSANGQSNGSASALEVVGAKVDISSSEQVDSWIASIVEKFGRLDCAANVAGVGGPRGEPVLRDLGDTTNEQWDYIIGINLTGMFYCLRAQLRVMKEGATILNVASMAGLKGREGLGAYSTSKHGVVGLTRTAAREYGPRGIRINALCPGPIDTPLLGRLREQDSARKEGLTSTYNTIPMKRLGTPEDMAKTIIYALSDDSSYTTGACLAADGGYCA